MILKKLSTEREVHLNLVHLPLNWINNTSKQHKTIESVQNNFYTVFYLNLIFSNPFIGTKIWLVFLIYICLISDVRFCSIDSYTI